jgi:hypothetical protein
VLREHLKSIQAFYKEIDAWIRHPDAERHLLEQIFDIDFDIDPSSTSKEEDHKQDDSTQASTVERGSDFSLSGEDSTCLSAVEEPQDDSSDDEKPAVLGKGFDLASDSRTKRAVADRELLLQELAADGQYTLFFHIAKGGQKEKLVKFIEFLEN